MRGGVLLIFLTHFIVFLATSQENRETIAGSDSLQVINPEDTLPAHQVLITDIFVVGNKKTKRGYILRELSVKRGDTIAYNQLRKQLNRDEEKVFNLRIFEESTATILDRATMKLPSRSRCGSAGSYGPSLFSGSPTETSTPGGIPGSVISAV